MLLWYLLIAFSRHGVVVVSSVNYFGGKGAEDTVKEGKKEI